MSVWHLLRRAAEVAVLGGGLLGRAVAAGEAVPAEWRTPAERTGFESTPSYQETLDFLQRVERHVPEMRLASFGRSGQGRPLTIVILSREKAFDAVGAHRVGKPVVMIENGIHPGEIDGKDACLAILRDLALGRHRELLEGATILVVPVYNVDGHERLSPFNHPNQDGPRAGMGFRTTAAGLDLNRDFMKAASPETRALLELVNEWRPHLHIDVHVTDGVDHDWVLTWGVAEAPQLPEAVDAWIKVHLPAALATTERAGYRCGPYVELKDRTDPRRGFSSNSAPSGRYSTGYFPLRGRASILVEMHSCKPYRTRVEAAREFLVSILAEVGRGGRQLVEAVRVAEASTVRAGKPDGAPSPAVLSYEECAEGHDVSFPIYRWDVATSQVTGKSLLRFERGNVQEIQVPWFHSVRPKVTVERPRGYLVGAGWPQIENLIFTHGLKATRLTTPLTIEVESLTLQDARMSPEPYQGQHRVEASVTRRLARRTFPAGTLWVPAAQPDFEVAIQLLEPEAPDSVVSWGLISTVVEQKEYIDTRNLEEWAVKALEDPVVAAEWHAALEDAAFASDSRARYRWWYERTPFWAAQEVGLVPVFRVVSAATARMVQGVASAPAGG